MRIIQFPHPTLRHPSKPVRRVDAELRRMIAEMFNLMYEARGIGLAANQVDLPLRLFIVNLDSDREQGEELVFINPVISRAKGSDVSEEGCLSLPGMYAHVARPKQVRIEAYDLQGQQIHLELDGMLARVAQHETDHLDGVLFFDHVPELRRPALEPALIDFREAFLAQRNAGQIPADEAIAAQIADWEGRYC